MGDVTHGVRSGPATVALLALRVVVLFIAVHVAGSRPLTDDLARFQEIAATPGVPYRTFPVEYAPGEVLFVESIGSNDARALAVKAAAVAFIADIGIWAAVRRGWGTRAGERYLWLGTPLLVFIYTRFDLVPVALAAWGACLAFRGAERSGGVSFAAAILSKVWPVVLLPAFIITHRRRALVWTLTSLALGVAAWVVFAGVDDVLQVLTFRHAKGWGVESTVGVITWIVTKGPVRLEAGAPRIGAAPVWATTALSLVLLGTLVAIWSTAARRQAGAYGGAAVAAVGALLACSPLFSLQFAAWLLPWGAIAGVDEHRHQSIVVGAVQVLTAILFIVYQPDRASAAQALLLLRDALVVALPVLWLLPARAPSVVRPH
jgi:hypothetical protein